jgi:hypothetical protein
MPGTQRKISGVSFLLAVSHDFHDLFVLVFYFFIGSAFDGFIT